MYTVPQLYGARNHLHPVEADAVSVCTDECTFRGLSCDPDIHALCELYMAQNEWTLPEDQIQAADLYLKLHEAILSDL